MKKIFFLLLFFPFLAFAQTALPVTKSITVTGTAEKEIVPDEIYFQVILKEFVKDKNKVSLDKIEKDFMKALQDAGIPQSSITIDQVYGQRWRQKRRSDAELLSSKSFRIKVSNPNIMDDVMDKVIPEAIENVEITDYTHSKMSEYKRELKIEAIKAAKVKAGYLLTAIDEQLGEALEVSEYDNISYAQPITYAQTSNVYMYSNSDGDASDYEAGFKKIKISYSVTVKFRIK